MVFVVNAFFQIPSSSFCEKLKEVENEEKTNDGLQKSLSEGKRGLFLINKRSLKTVHILVKSPGKFWEFLTFC